MWLLIWHKNRLLERSITRNKERNFIMLKGPSHQDMVFLSVLCAQLLGHVQLFVASWTVCQAPLSVGLSRQENWTGSPFPTPAALLSPEIKPAFPESPALAGILPVSALADILYHCTTWEAQVSIPYG